ncbi:MAG: hypothetical protein LBJ74_05140 [Heliobacteriaceae bacterium]|jgi:hypothetical protein|nr:hypothetical protein [Heliobacteriaceae bacterium]
MTNSLKASWKVNKHHNFGRQLKDAFIAAENHNAANIAKHGSFWKSFKHDFRTIPTVLKDGWKSGTTTWGKFKGLGSGFMKRMPLIGTLMLVAFELPNIIKAFMAKDEGIGTGVFETGKAAARVGAGTLGMVIGSIFPGIGSLIGGMVGWMLGEGLMSKIVGKTYSEKLAAKEEEAKAGMQQNINNPDFLAMTGAGSNTGVSPPMMGNMGSMMPMPQMPPLNSWNDDFMLQNYGMNPFSGQSIKKTG